MPLHPAVVHIPIALAALIPLAILGTAFIKNVETAHPLWIAITLAATLLTGSSFVALETGEQDEEIVENVVSESLIEGHEEAAETFAYATIVLAILALLTTIALSTKFRVPLIALTLIMSGVIGYLGYETGHRGGKLVYEHNAGAAHSQAGDTNSPPQRSDH